MEKKRLTFTQIVRIIGIVIIVLMFGCLFILKMIKHLEQQGSEEGAKAYVEAASHAAILYMMNDTKIRFAGTCQIDGNNIICNNFKTVDNKQKDIVLETNLKGIIPTGETITFLENGEVSKATLIIDGYKIICKQNDCAINGKRLK